MKGEQVVSFELTEHEIKPYHFSSSRLDYIFKRKEKPTKGKKVQLPNGVCVCNNNKYLCVIKWNEVEDN